MPGSAIEQRADVYPFDRAVPGRDPACHLDTRFPAGGGPEPRAHFGGRFRAQEQGLVDAQLADDARGLAEHRVLEREQRFDVGRAGKHDLTHHDVIGEVRRPRRVEIGPELALAGRALFARGDLLAKQRMGAGDGDDAALLSAALQGNRVALAVEGVARYRDATPWAAAGDSRPTRR